MQTYSCSDRKQHPDGFLYIILQARAWVQSVAVLFSINWKTNLGFWKAVLLIEYSMHAIKHSHHNCGMGIHVECGARHPQFNPMQDFSIIYHHLYTYAIWHVCNNSFIPATAKNGLIPQIYFLTVNICLVYHSYTHIQTSLKYHKKRIFTMLYHVVNHNGLTEHNLSFFYL